MDTNIYDAVTNFCAIYQQQSVNQLAVSCWLTGVIMVTIWIALWLVAVSFRNV